MVEDTEEENATEQHGSTKVKISLIVNSNPVAFEFESGARRFRSELMQLRLQLPGLIGELSGEEEEAELYEEVHTVTADYQATVDDDLILADATADPLTVTLNYSIYAGQRVEIVKSDSGGNAVSVVPKAGDTIEGLSSKSLAAQYDKVILISDGVHTWYCEKSSELL
jgi:hypothetical protein